MAMTQISTRYHKSRNGCMTCKIRKVKCGEERPACLRCTSTGRKCDGYRNSSKSIPIVGYLRVQHVDEQCLTPKEGRAVSYFQRCTAPTLLNLGSNSFWTRTLLQMCRQEGSIKHLVIAISLIDERQTSNFKNVPDNNVEHLHYYGKALKLLNMEPKAEIWTVLIAILLFCVFEDFESNGYAAFQHITSGRNILRTLTSEGKIQQRGISPIKNPIVEELIPIFSKLERQTWQFDPETLPPHNGVSLADLCRLEITTESTIPHGYKVESYSEEAFVPVDTLLFTSPELFSPFKSLDHANLALYALKDRCIAPQDMRRPPATRFHVVPGITNELNRWLEGLHIFVRTSTEKFLPEDLITISILRTLHLCLEILSQTSSFKNETLLDKYFDSFEYLLRKLSYTLDLTSVDVTPAFWFGATRCRDPATRRQAIQMMRRTDRKWWSRVGRGEILARAAERVMEIEEMGLEEISSCSDIPEENRIKVIRLEMEPEQTNLTVVFEKAPYDDTVRTDSSVIDLSDLIVTQGRDLELQAPLDFDWMAVR